MTGEQDDAKPGEPEAEAMREMIREAFHSGGVSLDRMIETFFEAEKTR
ncbi:MAG: hypothetical protein AAFU55_07715 [Pseudomonadota bacterium]